MEDPTNKRSSIHHHHSHPYEQAEMNALWFSRCQQRHRQRLKESRKLLSFNFKGSAEFGATQNAPGPSDGLEKMMT